MLTDDRIQMTDVRNQITENRWEKLNSTAETSQDENSIEV
jgi:hypothetical protein